jgi:hypothetical protein
MRAGELGAAREAFVLAGQPDLVRQVDELLGTAPRETAALGGNGVIAHRDGDGGRRPIASVEAQPVGATRAPPPQRPEPAMPLARFLERGELRAPPGEPFAVSPDGLLVIHVDGKLPMRTSGALASSGRLSYAPMRRRVRGRITDEPFGEGDDAMVMATGTGVVVVSPRAMRFTAVRLAEAHDVLYLREPAVFAFEESLSWENGRVPGGGATALEVVQLRGQGRVVMRTRKAPSTIRLGAAEVVYVDQGALVGWTGQVVPQQLRGLDGEPTQYVACSGEGALILEEPPPVLQEVSSPG